MNKKAKVLTTATLLLSLAFGGWVYFSRNSQNAGERMLLEEYTRASRDCFLSGLFQEECPRVGQIKLILMGRGIEPRIVELPRNERVR